MRVGAASSIPGFVVSLKQRMFSPILQREALWCFCSLSFETTETETITEEIQVIPEIPGNVLGSSGGPLLLETVRVYMIRDYNKMCILRYA